MIARDKKIIKRLWAALLIVSFLWSSAGPSYGNAFSVFVGTKPDERVPYNTITGPNNIVARTADGGGGVLVSGSTIQMIYLGGNDQISDPTDAGAVRADDVLVGTSNVGDDSDTNQTFTGLAGKFFHQIAQNDTPAFSGVTSGRADFLVLRIWNGAPGATGSTFGESQLFGAGIAANAGDPFPVPPPNSVLTQDIQVRIPKSAPAAPAITSTSSAAPEGQPPTASLTHARTLGTRSYEYMVSTPVARDAASPDTPPTAAAAWPASPTTTSLARAKRQADIPGLNGQEANRSESFNLSANQDFTWVRVRVRAVNDFGASNWTESAWVSVPRTPDPNRPAAITDFRLTNVTTTPAAAATLRWTAPTDRNRLNEVVPAVTYRIRTAVNPILDDASAPAGVEGFFTRWSQATPLAGTIPTPGAPGSAAELGLENITNGLHYYAIKSTDTLPDGTARESGISNLTGLNVGAGGVTVIVGGSPGVSDLVVTSTATNTATIQWTVPTAAPGAPALNITGWAARFASSSILAAAPATGVNATAWDAATPITLGTGQPSAPEGSPNVRQLVVALPQTGARFWAVRYLEGSNPSPISNLASVIVGGSGGGGGAGPGLTDYPKSVITGIAYDPQASGQSKPITIRFRVTNRQESTPVLIYESTNRNGPWTTVAGQGQGLTPNNDGIFSLTIPAPLLSGNTLVPMKFFRTDPSADHLSVVRRETFRRVEGRFGINTFSLDMNLELTTPAIGNLAELVRAINRSAGKNVVQSMHWWNEAEQWAEGFICRYGNDLNQVTFDSARGINPENRALMPDQEIQINVNETVNHDFYGYQ